MEEERTVGTAMKSESGGWVVERNRSQIYRKEEQEVSRREGEKREDELKLTSGAENLGMNSQVAPL